MKINLHTQVFLGIFIGIFLGLFFKNWVVVFHPIGEIFIRLLRLIMVPLVIASIISGIINLKNITALKILGFKTISFYIFTSAISVIIGLFLVNVIKPGVSIVAHDLPQPDLSSIKGSRPFSFIDLIPDNIFRALVDANMIGLILFSVLIGVVLLSLESKNKSISKFFISINDVMMLITQWIMKLAPLGVMALIAELVATNNYTVLAPIFLYGTTVILGLAIHFFLVLTVIVWIFSNESPFKFIKSLLPALATAFSTDSSVATIPVTVSCLHQVKQLKKKVIGFVVPLGATVNMDGTALYEAVAALFIAQAYDIHLTLFQQGIIVLTAILASVGAAGIPSAGLVTMVAVLSSVQLPIEGVGLILAIDRILDMFRTVTNVYGDAVGSLVISDLTDHEAFDD